jgi:hypothetical protein
VPNHVINEIIFRGVDGAQQDEILALCCGADGKVDFERLVPTPKNVWLFSVGKKHEKLGENGLDWSRANWGTKWNAYSHKPIERSDDSLTLRFETAWSPPYGWLVALFNSTKLDFDHNFLDEGASRGVSGQWRWPKDELNVFHDPWKEAPCDDEMQRHLHLLHWGVESFPDDEDSDDRTNASEGTPDA